MGGGNNVVALLLPSPFKIKLFIMEENYENWIKQFLSF